MKFAIFTPWPTIDGEYGYYEMNLIKAISMLDASIEFDVFHSDVIKDGDFAPNVSFHTMSEWEDKKKTEHYERLIYYIGDKYEPYHRVVEAFQKDPDVLVLLNFSMMRYHYERLVLQGREELFPELLIEYHGYSGLDMVLSWKHELNIDLLASRQRHLGMNADLVSKAQSVIVNTNTERQLIRGMRPDVPVLYYSPDFDLEVYLEFLAKDEIPAYSDLPYVYHAADNLSELSITYGRYCEHLKSVFKEMNTDDST